MLRPDKNASDKRGDELAKLLMRCAEGDRVAFSEFYQNTSAQMYGFALGILRDEGRAQECLQEVYLAVWRNAARYQAEKSTVMTWLSSITHHRAISYIRNYQRELLVDDWVAFLESSISIPSIAALTTSFPGDNDWEMLSAHFLDDCIDDLDDTKRNAIRQAFWGDCTYSDIAVQMNSPLNTIKSWVRRALQELKRCLDESGKNV